ncbi:hypothetical protein PRZ48_005999 [Zasmidium cellare]|uniref:IBR domain-containing protein n=1 Tax=Zasmidium cellare TaxID=395010 RepID=A0ABR0EN82_ZASCE|nr:hypothetical protein PRZ48_005999 [Zasmidium cellare]
MPTFECGICAEDKTEAEPIDIAGDKICAECALDALEPRFQLALEKEGAYPPPWGDVNLDVDKFKNVLGEDFVRRYKAREELYAIPIKLRRYCKHTDDSNDRCNAFLLPRPELPPDNKNLVCPECNRSPPVEEYAFESFKRGRDYQICPNPECELSIELLSGCNALQCKQASCWTQFCYICGKEAHHDSDHWSQGKPCPRWNQPGGKGAYWDRPAIPFEGLPNVVVSGEQDDNGMNKLWIKLDFWARRMHAWLMGFDGFPGDTFAWIGTLGTEGWLQIHVRLTEPQWRYIVSMEDFYGIICNEPELEFTAQAVRDRYGFLWANTMLKRTVLVDMYNWIIEGERRSYT